VSFLHPTTPCCEEVNSTETIIHPIQPQNLYSGIYPIKAGNHLLWLVDVHESPNPPPQGALLHICGNLPSHAQPSHAVRKWIWPKSFSNYQPIRSCSKYTCPTPTKKCHNCARFVHVQQLWSSKLQCTYNIIHTPMLSGTQSHRNPNPPPYYFVCTTRK
jgi:hypothetical protein